MKNLIHRDDWHLITDDQLESLFKGNLPIVSANPNATIIKRLRLLGVATLELLENRSSSTVYRIRQTDEVYQVFIPSGETHCYDTDEYQAANHTDQLLESFQSKDPVFVCSTRPNGVVLIEHKKYPRFVSIFNEQGFKETSWLDEKPDDINQIAKLMRKASAFYASYLKKG
jgi:hypothetical protein